MNRQRLIRRGALAVAVLAVVTLASTLYVVPEAQEALVLRFGRPIAVHTEPGLWAKLPFVDTVTYYDQRLLSLEPPTEIIILGDQKRVAVDTYTQFRIVDPLQFNQTVLTVDQARSQLTQAVGSSLRRVLGQVELPALLSTERNTIIGNVRKLVADSTRSVGIEVVDVQIRRADLPAETSQAIYDRMTSDRQREAKELRAQGSEWAQEIQAKADRDRTELLADAELKARLLHSGADGEASKVFTDAFAHDPNFFTFYRAMQSYRQALAASAPTLVLSPQSELLRYFNNAVPAGSKP